MPLSLAVLLSGSGTTLENIFVRIEKGELDASVAVVIGTKESAYGLERARKRDVPTQVVKPKDYESTEEFSTALTKAIDAHDAGLIVLAGFMFLYKIPDKFTGKVMNIHPALIPAFCGKGFYGHHVHEAVLERGAKVTGCTVHFVDNVYDNGPIILQKVVDVAGCLPEDSILISINRAGKVIIPHGDTIFQAGDILTAFVRQQDIEALHSCIRGGDTEGE